ncbi:MAG: HDOD domain-containing protein [Candidatus Latescibacteria bacterium]|nr:HDOD domain-containing protein [bacterium]MBD3422950.1 HDOD domain-containing protein [Candidatus Latescibacterota bacterium]
MTVTSKDGIKRTRGDKAASVRKLTDLPTLPGILIKIWKLAESPDTSSKDLEKVISLDQTLTAKVIRLANSPFYFSSSHVNNVQDAIVNIGMKTVRSLAAAVSISSVFKKSRTANKNYFPLKDFWRHCIGVGVTSGYLAGIVDGIDRDFMFCAGILHDIGKFALNILFPDKFGEALQIASSERCSITAAERKVLDTDHAHFGEKLAQYWNLGDDLSGILGNHHRALSEVDEMLRIETALLKIADSIVREIRFGFPGDFLGGEFDPASMELLDLSTEKIEQHKDGVNRQIEKAAELVDLI